MQSLYNRAFDFIDNSKPSYLGIYASLLLHFSLLLFAIGLPDFFRPKQIIMPQIIPIEILNISEETSLSASKEINNKKEKKIEQKKFNASENIETSKIDLQEKPKKNLIKNENVIKENVNSKEITIEEKKITKLNQDKNQIIDNPEVLNQKKIKPKLKPKPKEQINSNSDIKIENKAKPKVTMNEDKSVIDKPKPEQKPEPDFNLATMLKDLRNEDPVNVKNSENEEKKLEEKDDERMENKKSIEVSISEMDLVLQQLRGCFNPRAGTQIVGDEMVKISAKIDRNAYVKKDTVQIIATNLSKSNPYYEAITESAVATLYNPLCSKLKLPLEKYESWKDLKITIDYSWIKN